MGFLVDGKYQPDVIWENDVKIDLSHREKTFGEFLKDVLNKSDKFAYSYERWLDIILKDYSITLSNITLDNIDDLLNKVRNNPSYKRVKHGNSYVSVLNMYKKYLNYLQTTKYGFIPEEPSEIVVKRSKSPNVGPDDNTMHISYARTVLDNEKIPGLCRYLEGEYERILGYARKLFEKFNIDFKRIRVILSPELKAKVYTNSEDQLVEVLYELMNKPNTTKDDIRRALRTKKTIVSNLFGEYFGLSCTNEPYIVIYYKNFNTKDLEKYKALVSQTLAHEFMHYLHECIANTSYSEKSPHAVMVKEAIADFFSVMYSIYTHSEDKKLVVASDRYKSWVKNFGSSWPYANALYFMMSDNRIFDFSPDYHFYEARCCISKFIYVLDKSKQSLEDGYNALKN